MNVSSLKRKVIVAVIALACVVAAVATMAPCFGY